MTRSSILIFFCVEGVLWALFASWAFIGLGGAAELNFAYLSKTLLVYSWMFLGPLLLIGGAILSFRTHHRVGSILLMIGCTMLTIEVGYQSVSMLKDLADPLIMKPPYGIWAVGIALTLLSDFGAVQLYRWK
jgi:hypothetical protein